MHKLLNKRNGFTLIEIMIVTGIIAVVTGTAIPHLMRGRLDASEGAVVGIMRSYSTSLESFRGMNSLTGYPADLTALIPPGEPPYISEDLAVLNPRRNGYNFFYTQVAGLPSVQYHIYAEPVSINISGTRGFYVDENGVISSITVAAGEPGHAPPGSVIPPGYSQIR